MEFKTFIIYLLVMVVTTYLVRAIPLILIKKKIENRFLNAFLYYIPYTVLSAMTFPAILYATGSTISAAIGLFVAVILAVFRKGLIVVACGACVAVLIVELVMSYL